MERKKETEKGRGEIPDEHRNALVGFWKNLSAGEEEDEMVPVSNGKDIIEDGLYQI